MTPEKDDHSYDGTSIRNTRRCCRQRTVLFAEDRTDFAKSAKILCEMTHRKTNSHKKRKSQNLHKKQSGRAVRDVSLVSPMPTCKVPRQLQHLVGTKKGAKRKTSIGIIEQRMQLNSSVETVDESTSLLNKKNIPIRCRRQHLREFLVGASSCTSSNSINTIPNTHDESKSVSNMKVDEENSKVLTASAQSIKRQNPRTCTTKNCNQRRPKSAFIIANSKSSSLTSEVLETHQVDTPSRLLGKSSAESKRTESDNSEESQSVPSSIFLSLPRPVSLPSQIAVKVHTVNAQSQNDIFEKASKEGLVESCISEIDPMTDIRYWKKIIEKEGNKNGMGEGQYSFHHAIAGVIVKKNANEKRAENNGDHSNQGFLWLPSILEGGMDIGL